MSDTGLPPHTFCFENVFFVPSIAKVSARSALISKTLNWTYQEFVRNLQQIVYRKLLKILALVYSFSRAISMVSFKLSVLIL